VSRLAPLAWLLVAACAGSPPGRPRVGQAPAFDPARIGSDVAWLADDAREGRGAGTRGLAEAARFVADAFADAGLEPARGAGVPGTDFTSADLRTHAYLQPFAAPVAISIAEAELEVEGVALVRGSDFEALLSSADGAAEHGLVFAGYGISDPESGWDEYAGIDVEGRIVLVLDDRPRHDEGPLAGGAGARFLRRAYKVANARKHGAAALLLAPAAPGEGLPGAAGNRDANPSRQPSELLGFAVSRAAAERLVAAAGGPDLAERQRRIDEERAPQSEPLAGLRGRAAVRIERTPGELANVLGLLSGADPDLAHETVVVGAHLDHLGRGEFGTLAPDAQGQIHNGADDNASGVTGLLAVARALAAGPPLRRSVLFAAFSGEEMGLLGSAHYVEHPARPLADTVAMLNLDMVGRLSEGRLTVFGAETSPAFEPLVRAAGRDLPLAPEFAEGAFAPSDQTSFHAKGVPVLHFFSGTHPQYHTPDDDAALVNAEGIALVARLVAGTTAELANAAARPPVVLAAAPRAAAGEGGYGPWLGTVPAFGGPPVRGVRLQAVRPGSPAEGAGLRAGDVIVEFAGAPVANLEEFAAILFGSRAGERVEIVVERAGGRVATSAVLGQRR
jgi:hypothetical protein